MRHEWPNTGMLRCRKVHSESGGFGKSIKEQRKREERGEARREMAIICQTVADFRV